MVFTIHRGRYDDGSSRGFPGFLIKTSRASFEFRGKQPVRKQLLGTLAISEVFLSITALTNMFGTPSGPEALFSGKVLALSTSSLVVTSSIFSELFCTIQSTRGRV